MVLEGALPRIESGLVEAFDCKNVACLYMDGFVDRTIGTHAQHLLEHELIVIDGIGGLGSW